MEEESFKRREDCFKYTDNVLNKTDQLHFLKTANQIYQNQDLAGKIVKIRREHWKIVEEKVEKKKEKKKKQKMRASTTNI